ncbi:hypothetical protein QE152_g14301 [Popillia japonica]|uniref:Uncharacterized protein n=1 Tax=Popillia japonica TaxID=7064 RepID=A0AAW1L9R9_POPJA
MQKCNEYEVVRGIGATAQNTPSAKPKPRNLQKSASQPAIKIVRRSIQNKNRKLQRNRFSRTENIPQELSSPKIKRRNISNENNPTRSAVSSSEQGQYDVVLRLGSYSENSPPPKYLRNSHSIPEDPLSSIEDNEYDIVVRTGGHAEEACNQLVLYEGDDNSNSDFSRSQLENTMQEVVPYGGNSRPHQGTSFPHEHCEEAQGEQTDPVQGDAQEQAHGETQQGSQEDPHECPQEEPHGSPHECPQDDPHGCPHECPPEDPHGCPPEDPQEDPHGCPHECPPEDPHGCPPEGPQEDPCRCPHDMPCLRNRLANNLPKVRLLADLRSNFRNSSSLRDGIVVQMHLLRGQVSNSSGKIVAACRRSIRNYFIDKINII